MSVEKHTFDSGLQVAVEHVPYAFNTSVNVLVNVGGLDEQDSEAGISHLLEHSVHKSTALWADSNEREDFKNRNQYVSNATTGPTFTVYYGQGPHFDPLIRGLSATVATPALTDAHIAEEVSVVTREAKMFIDEPGRRFGFAVMQHMFNSPYSRPTIGYWDRLNYSGDEVRDYYRQAYSLGKVAVIAAGKATMEEVVDAAERYLEESPLSLHPNGGHTDRFAHLPEVVLGQPGRYGIYDNKPNNVDLRSMHTLGDDLIGAYLSEEKFAYRIAETLISMCVGSALREERQLSYDGGYGVVEDSHPATWRAFAGVTCEPAKTEVALEVFHESINSARNISREKLELALLGAEGFALRELDNISARCGRISNCVERGIDPWSADDIVEAFRKITPAKVADAVDHLIGAYNESEKYVFVNGDVPAINSYPLIEAHFTATP